MSQNTKQYVPTELGEQPIGKLLAGYAIPAIIAMVASSVYNIVDSIFVGQGVGDIGISGMAVASPFMNLGAAFGAMIGVGASTVISVRLGQGKYDVAQNILGNTITLNVVMGLLLTVICLVFLDDILYIFGASEQTIPYAREYMIVILLGNVITHLYFGTNAVLRAASKPREAMYITIFTVVLNSILDPLFIYTFDMGISGAAYATVLSQAIALVLQTRLFCNPKEMLHLKRGIYSIDLTIVKNILGIGVSPFAMNATACLVSIFINQRLLQYGGDLAVGAYGIANRVAFIFIMINFGVNQGMQPIAGYNYGAQKFDRLMRVLKLAMIAGTCITTTGFLVAELMPGLCVRLFTDDAELSARAVNGLRIMMAAMPIVGYQMIVTNFFQSIGKAKISIFLSLSRQMLILIPMLLILPPLMGIDGVWTAMPISDTISALLALAMMVRYMKRFNRQHKEMIANGQQQ